LYLDASAIIYSIEGVPQFREPVLAWIDRAGRVVDGQILTSRISRLECRSKPLATGNQALLARYDAFLGTLKLGSLTDELVERATDIRARFSLRSVDALHLATAISEQASVFLTGDGRLDRCTELNVVVLQP
jgi:predicted nucleic acid-binding protein